eukprot:1701543-Karenia_brevis.AAC.1
MKAGDKHEDAAIHVPWTLLLSCKLEIRQPACALVNDDGYTYGKALEVAMKDSYTRDIHFVSLLALMPALRSALPVRLHRILAQLTRAAGQKGSKKGRRKGKKSGSKDRLRP